MYGYASPGVLAPQEADAVRKASSRLFDGQSEGEAVRWLNGQGYLTARGNEWRTEVLHRLLTNPRIAGLDSSGEPIEGWGESVLTPDEYRRLQKLFAERSAGRTKARERYEYLISSGGAGCGKCETDMVGARVNGTAPPSYRCPSPTETQKSCGSVRMNADRLEDAVAEHLLAELLKPGARGRLEALQGDVEAEIARLREHIGRADERFASIGVLHGRGLMVEAAFLAAQKANKDDLRTSRARLRYLEQMTNLPIGDVNSLVSWWNQAPHASKRALLLLEVEKVWVLPQSEGGGNDPNARIRIQWRQTTA